MTSARVVVVTLVKVRRPGRHDRVMRAGPAVHAAPVALVPCCTSTSARRRACGLLISSAHTGNQPNAAELVLNSVLRVCKDMSVECSQAKQ